MKLRGYPRALAVLLAGAIGAGLLAACDVGGPSPPALHILAGSELKDLEPLLPDVQKATGLNLKFDYIGTLDGAAAISGGDGHAMAWFSSNRYLTLLPGATAKILAQQRMMLSPVVLGVKKSTAQGFGWEGNPNLTWKDIAEKAAAGNFKFAMTDPSASNSGFSALVGVASAFSGTGNALTAADIRPAPLTALFAGQKLTAGSSGFLADSYVKEQDTLDGMINYESVLLGLNASRSLKQPLDLVYPKEGIVTADYPLMLLSAGARPDYDKLVAYFRKAEVQTRIMTQTHRRPAVPEVQPDRQFSTQVLVEVPFPASLDVVNQLISVFLNQVRLPSHTYFVLDISGSMQGSRLDGVKKTFANLTGGDTSITGQFARFRAREEVTIVTFNGTVQDTQNFTVNDPTPGSPDLQRVLSFVDRLQASDGTAIYDALIRAFTLAGQAKAADPNRFYSVVLMTDGENNAGNNASQFQSWYRGSNAAIRSIKCFAVIFGEASPQALNDVANLTGGRTFDARTASLPLVFKEIRGYQ
ncbi:MAG: substrate-binding domain-containing protein [Candidatus Dormibacteraceae bacterium]